MITHIVSFKLKEENKDANIQQMKSLLEALPAKIAEIKDFEVGVNFVEGGYDVVLYSTFASQEDLKTYAVHPDHLEVVAFIKQVISDRVVVDYEK